MTLDWRAMEEKWQRRWGEERIFEADPDPRKPKLFITVAYPYPNSPQHVGHGRTFTLTDVYARYRRMRGFNVLFPMAFHYTGTPILAMAKRVASGDSELIDEFTRIYRVPPEVVKQFTEPIKIADYFHEEIRRGMMEIGYSIDWRREFTTIDPPYSRFIEWQFEKLREKGLITKGSHPVGWCPSCGSPMGQHDTKGDVEPEIGDYVVIKFRYGEEFLPTATLRPETVFGVTNIWVRPDIQYVRAEVDGTRWIVSEECAEKLRLLNRKAHIIGTVSGQDLVGDYAENLVTREKIPILPASFVDPKNATGVVMSVPGHAPYDYVALEDLKKRPSELASFGVGAEVLKKIRPVAVIELDGYSEIPASDVLKLFKVESQSDPKVEDATRELYSQEFHRGRMRVNTGRYAGMAVSQARERVREDLLRGGWADTMWELLNRPVFCRCGAEIAVKIFEDQWFIDYGNPDWKRLAHQCLEAMRIVPDEMREEFRNVIDWLKEKACARKQGLGTRLPWDPEWIIESLSDSVIYMSYYTIAKHLRQHSIDARRLGLEVFDYVLLGVGDPKAIGERFGLDPKVLESMREEFLYFYPLDSRDSGRDLVPNHLTYFIFNHAALFPETLWPRQIVVNGSVLMEGKKMSKSFGNIIPLRNALASYGADPFRVAILSTAELLQDADFSNILAKSVKERLERFYASAVEVMDRKGGTSGEALKPEDSWMLSRLQQHITIVTQAMENLRVREAIHDALYMLDQDIQWYTRRTSLDAENPQRRRAIARTLREVLAARVLLLTPFTPHLCEEVWSMMGGKGFVSTAQWPSYDSAKFDSKIIEEEELVKSLLEDTVSIVRAMKVTPKKICYYVASSWKWDVYLEALRMAKEGPVNVEALMKKAMTRPDVRGIRQAPAFIRNIVEATNRMPSEVLEKRLSTGAIDELRVIGGAAAFYAAEFKAEVSVYREDDSDRYDPRERARLAVPYRPGIYVE